MHPWAHGRDTGQRPSVGQEKSTVVAIRAAGRGRQAGLDSSHMHITSLGWAYREGKGALCKGSHTRAFKRGPTTCRLARSKQGGGCMERASWSLLPTRRSPSQLLCHCGAVFPLCSGNLSAALLWLQWPQVTPSSTFYIEGRTKG